MEIVTVTPGRKQQDVEEHIELQNSVNAVLARIAQGDDAAAPLPAAPETLDREEGR
jgi:hypothetical protein